MMNYLPRVIMEVEGVAKEFFRDDRLQEYRNVNNPHEMYTFDEIDGDVLNVIQAILDDQN